MAPPNVYTAQIEFDHQEPAGFSTGSLEIHQLLGASELLVNVVEIEAGSHLCPYHYEYVEEWLVVLSGDAEVRTPQGTSQLRPGDVMCFKAGPEGAHRVSSPTDGGPTRVLMFSKDADPAVCVYPDSDKLAVYTRTVAEDEVFVRRAAGTSHLEYFDGETA